MTTIILLLFGGRLWSIRLLRFASVNIYMQLNHQGFAVIKEQFCWEKGVTPLLIISTITDFNLIFIGHTFYLTREVLGRIKNPCSTVFYHSTCNRKQRIKKYDYKERKHVAGPRLMKQLNLILLNQCSIQSFMYPWCRYPWYINFISLYTMICEKNI